MNLTIQWWSIPALLTVLSAVCLVWPSRAVSVWNEMVALVVTLCVIAVNLAVWLIGALLK
ncbi:hypothetical protein [Achromobacter sp. UBA2119]|uniref:hypothetical protein n=1 Tax=Achromobacter sp. UBA2119 TaxID=1945911 RepID=UPI002580B04C|nr:hypothetical protein [Achromobacter sp. UBA2119]